MYIIYSFLIQYSDFKFYFEKITFNVRIAIIHYNLKNYKVKKNLGVNK
jgi:hypothetical protein